MAYGTLKIEARLRPKNQITLPEKIAARLGLNPEIVLSS
jgi:bifunctional DNA-binding transcriptional regulator/antitoxin component of YhaV-PrlF toxin-antitoxin module